MLFASSGTPRRHEQVISEKSAPQVRNLARSERFELPALGIEIRCSIQLSYERTRCLLLKMRRFSS